MESSPYCLSCCICPLLSYNCNMIRTDYTALINELSASEGVFTTAQAERLGIPRAALSNAQKSGRLIRIAQGAYVAAAAQSTYTDELAAIWKLTDPSRMSHERMKADQWDGITVAGTTAASLLGIGDFYLTPYRVLSPQRINSRNQEAHFSTRMVAREDVSFNLSFPVTKLERTLIDLVLDNEDPSLILSAYSNAKQKGLNQTRLNQLINQECNSQRTKSITQLVFNKG